MRAHGMALALLVLVGGCGRGGEQAPSVLLPEGQIAEVAGDAIQRETIRRIRTAQGVAPEGALRSAIFDALLAAEFRPRDTRRLAAYAERAALARLVLDELAAEARAAGPPTDEEIRTITHQRWWELDRPELRRTVHAVVLREAPEDDERARALALRIREAVDGARDATDFADKARTVDPGALSVRVERLEPVARDGRAADPKDPPLAGKNAKRYVSEYAQGAFAVLAPGKLSEIVASEFGYHVIFVEERIEEYRPSLEERRALLAGEVFSQRAAQRLERLTTRLRAETTVSIERSAIASTEKVRAVP